MSFRRIEPDEAKELLDSDEGFVFLDVRSTEEFATARIPGSVNIPLFHAGPGGMTPNHAFADEVARHFPRGDAKLIIGCRRGNRSYHAAQLLASTGYTNLLEMRGGLEGESDAFGRLSFPGWVPRGYPVVSGHA